MKRLSIIMLSTLMIVVLVSCSEQTNSKETLASCSIETCSDVVYKDNLCPDHYVEEKLEEATKVEDGESEEDTSEAEDNEPSSSTENKSSYEVKDVVFYMTKDDYTLGTKGFFGAVEIENTGDIDLYFEEATFDFVDDDDHLLTNDEDVYTFPSVIKPGEKGYAFVEYVSFDESISLDNGINLEPQLHLIAAKGMPLQYETTDTAIRIGTYGGVSVTGRLKNDTDEDSEIEIFIPLRDAEGKIIDILHSYHGVFKQQTASIDVHSYSNTSYGLESVASYEVYTEKWLYFEY